MTSHMAKAFCFYPSPSSIATGASGNICNGRSPRRISRHGARAAVAVSVVFHIRRVSREREGEERVGERRDKKETSDKGQEGRGEIGPR